MFCFSPVWWFPDRPVKSDNLNAMGRASVGWTYRALDNRVRLPPTRPETSGRPLHHIGKRKHFQTLRGAVLHVAPGRRGARDADPRHVALAGGLADLDVNRAFSDYLQHLAERAARCVAA